MFEIYFAALGVLIIGVCIGVAISAIFWRRKVDEAWHEGVHAFGPQPFLVMKPKSEGRVAVFHALLKQIRSEAPK